MENNKDKESFGDFFSRIWFDPFRKHIPNEHIKEDLGKQRDKQNKQDKEDLYDFNN